VSVTTSKISDDDHKQYEAQSDRMERGSWSRPWMPTIRTAIQLSPRAQSESLKEAREISRPMTRLDKGSTIKPKERPAK
jgi:hypothetical protein